MAPQDFKRKLTAILSADVKGYSRLMGEDEEATVRTLTAYREVLSTVIQKHRGRVVDSPGDNMLAEFASVVDAVRSAVEIQEELKARNAELLEDRRMEFRIGINLGDVIQEGDRIYGDGVNVAARVESLADAEGLCISRSAYDQVKNKLSLGYDYLGEHRVKNITEPVRVYKVILEPEAVGKVIGEKRPKPKRQKVALAVIVAFLLVVGVVLIWKFFLRIPSTPVEVASVEKMAFPLPDKPSIAVLPFVNMSDDPKQEYFSDGLTEDLITDLSKISGLFVIARNSTFTYKGKPVKVKQVAQELGVRYVLEGSVRKAIEQVRINAQLIDATTGHHLWAERYDGKMGDIFALQDRITQKIVAALAVKLTAGEQERSAIKETNSIDAYDAFLQGWEHYLRRTPDDFAKALPYFENAIQFDPNYGRAYAALALIYLKASTYGWTRMSMRDLYPTARIRAQQYLELAMKNPTSVAHRVASEMALTRRKHQKAFAEAERAIAIDPNDAEGHMMMAQVMLYVGRPEETITSAKRAMLLDPRNIAFPLGLQGQAHFCMEQFEEAATFMERALKLNPNRTGFASTLAAAYAHLGRNQEARSALDIYTKPWLVPATLQRIMYFKPYKNPEDAELFADGLLKAGLPGKPSGYYKASEEHRLTGDEIKDLFFGHTMTGLHAGRKWSISRTRDGKTAFLLDSKVIAKGKSWIEGDMLCHQWEKRFEGLKYYISVFRNPEGTLKEKNEYILISDWNIYGISIED